MSLSATLGQLTDDLLRLNDSLSALDVTVREDRPSPPSPALVDGLGDSIAELLGSVEEAITSAAQAARMVELDARSTEIVTALYGIHHALNRVAQRYAQDLASYEKTEMLLRMGRTRGREWRAFSEVVRSGTVHLARPLAASHSALLECWRDLAERQPAPAGEPKSPSSQSISGKGVNHVDR